MKIVSPKKTKKNKKKLGLSHLQNYKTTTFTRTKASLLYVNTSDLGQLKFRRHFLKNNIILLWNGG